MKSRRRFSRKLIFSSALFCLFSVLYLYFGLLPGGLKNYAIWKIESVLPIQVRFDKLLVLPVRGVSFANLKVADKKGRLLFSAKNLSLAIKIIPFLRENKIIIRNVFMDSPHYDVALKRRRIIVEPAPPKTKISGQINVPVVSEESNFTFESLLGGPEVFLPEYVYLEQIEIKNGRVVIRKEASLPPLEVIRSIDVRMGFQKPPKLLCEGSFSLGENIYASLSLKGTWNLETDRYEFNIQEQSRRIPNWLLDYQKNNPLILEQGRLLFQGHLASVDAEKAAFDVEVSLGEAKLSAGDSVTDAESPKRSLDGKMKLQAKGVFNFETKVFPSFQGVLELNNVRALNLSKEVPLIDQMKGHIFFGPDLLTFQNIQCQFNEVPLSASGKLTSFKNPLVELQIEANSNIKELISLLRPDEKKFLENVSLDGDCRSVTSIQGPVKTPDHLQKETKLTLKNGLAENIEKKIRLEDLKGEIFINNLGLKISDGQFRFQKDVYQLQAFIPKNPDAIGEANLRSSSLSLWARYQLKLDRVVIPEGSFQSEGFLTHFKGVLSDWQTPTVNVEGDFEAHLEQMKNLIATKTPQLKTMGLKGALRGYFTLEGPWQEIPLWDLKIDATAKPLYVKENFKLDDFEIQVRMKNNQINIPYIHARPYGGNLGARILLDLSKTGTFFDTKISAYNLHLEEASKDLGVQNLSGIAVLQMNMRGVLEAEESYRGQGVLNIENGRLWETELFKKMGNLIFVKVEGLNRVIFHTLSGTFKIEDKKILTDDLTMSSDTVDLSLKGSIGFDTTLDMLMDIQFSNGILQGAAQTGGLVPLVVDAASGFISNYHLSGTLKEPKYEKTGRRSGVNRVIGKNVGQLLQTLTQ